MKSSALVALSAASFVSANFLSSLLPRQAVTCYDGPLILVARGSGEPAGTGIIGPIANNISSQLPGSHVQALKYPASFDDYFHSEPTGRRDLTRVVEQYDKACSNGTIILMGYSQGAAVVADSLCGTSDSTGATADSPALPMNYTSSIIAILTFGDPTFVPGQPWDAGTSKHKGLFPRENNTACDPYASIWHSYCDTNDFYCASGVTADAHKIHASYPRKYGAVAAEFAVMTAKNATSSGSGSGSMPTPTASGSGSAAQTGAASTEGVSVAGVVIMGFSSLWVAFL